MSGTELCSSSQQAVILSYSSSFFKALLWEMGKWMKSFVAEEFFPFFFLVLRTEITRSPHQMTRVKNNRSGH
jgi:hypothetical protein